MESSPHSFTRLAIVLSPLVMAGQAFSQTPDAGSTSFSASYSLHAAPVGESGGPSNGATVSLESSTGETNAGGVATATTLQENEGFTGQLYDPMGLTIAASPNPVDEGTTSQLGGETVMDDATIVALAPTDINWSVLSGPVNSVSAAAVALAGQVYEDTEAVVQGSAAGFTDDQSLLVLNADTDNFGSYGGDTIDDAWQVQYFGSPPNADAAATVDADGDGDRNIDEWITGFDPTDGASFFRFTITGRTGGTATFIVNKVMPERTYELVAGPDLAHGFPETVTTVNPTVEEQDRDLQDDNANGNRKFYQIIVTKP